MRDATVGSRGSSRIRGGASTPPRKDAIVELTIPTSIVTWLRESEDLERPELTRELRIQLSSPGSERHPARITAIVSLWHEVAEPTGRVRELCLCDAEGPDLSVALERLGHVLLMGS